MASDLQLGQKLGMSLDDLIKKTQSSKKKAPTKTAADKKKPANAKPAKKAAKAKPAQPNAKGRRQNKPVEPKQTGAIKKNTAKKPNRTAVSNAPKRVAANPRAANPRGVNPRAGNRNQQPSQTRVGDLLNMNVAVGSKRDAEAAMVIAKQLEAEARKYLGPPPSSQRQQQQQQHRGGARQQQRQVAPQRQAPQPRPQQRRAPYAVAQASYWPEPETENYLADHDRMSDRDSEQMDMDEPDLKPNLASLQAQATQFARGVRGQSRR